VELNWRDNPFFPKILNATRLDDLANRPDQYDWVWNGGFRTVVEGAHYSKLLLKAKEQKRIDLVPARSMMQVRAYFDIGGTGARADAVAIWIWQFVGQKINVLYLLRGARATALRRPRLDALARLGQSLGDPAARRRAGDKVFATSYESAIREA